MKSFMKNYTFYILCILSINLVALFLGLIFSIFPQFQILFNRALGIHTTTINYTVNVFKNFSKLAIYGIPATIFITIFNTKEIKE